MRVCPPHVVVGLWHAPAMIAACRGWSCEALWSETSDKVEVAPLRSRGASEVRGRMKGVAHISVGAWPRECASYSPRFSQGGTGMLAPFGVWIRNREGIVTSAGILHLFQFIRRLATRIGHWDWGTVSLPQLCSRKPGHMLELVSPW